MDANAILGIDASLTHTGIGAISLVTGLYKMADTCVTKYIGNKRLLEQEVWMKDVLERMVSCYELTPRMMVIEGYAFSPVYRGKQGGVKIGGRPTQNGELGGVLRMIFIRRGIPIVVVAPTTLKKWVTGSGQGDKNLILLKAYQKYKIEFRNDHECDAYALADIGRVLCNIDDGKTKVETLLKYEREVLKTVRESIRKELENDEPKKKKKAKKARKKSNGSIDASESREG